MGAGERLRFVSGVNVYARSERDPRQLMPVLRQEVRRVDANLVVSDMRTLDAQLDVRLSNERMLSVSSAFAVLATLLSVVGLYGVLAFVLTRRTRGIGIRMALGAERARVVRLVMGEVALLLVVGLGAGVAAALAGGRCVESRLFGVAAGEPLAYAVSVVALGCAALAASLVPARRASRIEPVRALRCEWALTRAPRPSSGRRRPAAWRPWRAGRAPGSAGRPGWAGRGRER
jgi:ABC-type antimicrobial peptide transport system permease subunit